MQTKKNRKPNTPAIFWLVKWGEQIRCTNRKVNTAREACEQCWGMVSWNMAVKPLTPRVSDLRRAKWFSEQHDSPEGWKLVPENELPLRIDVEMRRSNTPRIVSGVVRWKDDGKTPALEDEGAAAPVAAPQPAAPVLAVGGTLAQRGLATLTVGEFCYHVSETDAESERRGKGDTYKDPVRFATVYRPCIVVAGDPMKYPLDYTMPTLEGARGKMAILNMAMGLTPEQCEEIVNSSLKAAIIAGKGGGR